MIITRRSLAEMIMRYVNREITLASLVNWAEEMVSDADFEKEGFDVIRDVLLRIGLADVREFGLTWDECHHFLHRLGYDVKVELIKV